MRKLRHAVRLTPDDEVLLTGLSAMTRRVERGDMQRDGTEPQSIVLMLEGWSCRYKQLENGKRQITTVFVPGDLCEPFGAVPPGDGSHPGRLDQLHAGLRATSRRPRRYPVEPAG